MPSPLGENGAGLTVTLMKLGSPSAQDAAAQTRKAIVRIARARAVPPSLVPVSLGMIAYGVA